MNELENIIPSLYDYMNVHQLTSYRKLITMNSTISIHKEARVKIIDMRFLFCFFKELLLHFQLAFQLVCFMVGEPQFFHLSNNLRFKDLYTREALSDQFLSLWWILSRV